MQRFHLRPSLSCALDFIQVNNILGRFSRYVDKDLASHPFTSSVDPRLRQIYTNSIPSLNQQSEGWIVPAVPVIAAKRKCTRFTQTSLSAGGGNVPGSLQHHYLQEEKQGCPQLNHFSRTKIIATNMFLGVFTFIL